MTCRVELQELGWPIAVVAQVEAAVEAWVATLEACRNLVPELPRDLQYTHHAVVRDRAGHQLAAHAFKFGGGVFEVGSIC